MDFKYSGELGGVMADGYFSCIWVKIISTPQYTDCSELGKTSEGKAAVWCSKRRAAADGVRGPGAHQWENIYHCWNNSAQTI